MNLSLKTYANEIKFHIQRKLNTDQPMNMNTREVKTNILVSVHQPPANALHENAVKINNLTHSHPLSKHKKMQV